MAQGVHIPVMRSGHIKGYDIVLHDNMITGVREADGKVWQHKVPGYGPKTSFKSLVLKPGFAIGWVAMEDDMEILYFYDKDDDNFGYAFNLDVDYFSEWGYAPFGREG